MERESERENDIYIERDPVASPHNRQVIEHLPESEFSRPDVTKPIMRRLLAVAAPGALGVQSAFASFALAFTEVFSPPSISSSCCSPHQSPSRFRRSEPAPTTCSLRLLRWKSHCRQSSLLGSSRRAPVSGLPAEYVSEWVSE